jgi:hypothetical protein
MINPKSAIELDELRIKLCRGGEKSRRAAALLAIVTIALCLIVPIASAAPQNRETTLTTAQLEELLDKATALNEKYLALFRDLTAEEKRVFELYDQKTGKIKDQRQTVSDLIVYQSPRDPNSVTEYRNIREVDGKPVKKQLERVEKLFERVTKADSLARELDRINRESTRHDFDALITGFTIFNAAATHKDLRPLFKCEFAGRERLRDQDMVVVKFEQIEFKKDLFGMRQYEKLNVTGPLMRGQYWLDPHTGQVRREHHEIFFRDNNQPRTFKVTEVDYEFTTGEQGIWLLQRMIFQFFNPSKWDKDKKYPIEMFLNGRITSEYGPFRRFEVKSRHENVPNQYREQ